MIASETLKAIGNAIQTNADPENLRRQFPGIVFSACSDDDIPARIHPVSEAGQYRLYLVGGEIGECARLTDDLESAAGVIVARMDEE